ncbi:MAG: hypothetical protein NTX22_01905 [Ignavibacteriales bacterium]|nr:hypothetical protein [Ignavibacteriales bacterium]
MKPYLFFLTFIVIFYFTACNENDAVVGSNSDRQISSLSFIVDTTYLDGSSKRLVAKGIVQNNTNSTVSSPWYVEAQFFTDTAQKTKLGGNNTQIGVPLSKGQSTFWTIEFYSSNVDVTKYPNFSVGELRGIYK